MTSHNQIFLIRHGETEWSRTGQHTGNTDLPLTEHGRRQGEALGTFFAGRTFARVLSSPLRRAYETCQLAGFADVAERTDDLKEWNYGIYEGKKTIEIQKSEPGWSIWRTTVPEGESLEEVAVRTRRVIQSVSGVEGDVALFAHGHVLRILIASWLGLAARDGRLFALGAGSISILGWEHSTQVLEQLNFEAGSLRSHE